MRKIKTQLGWIIVLFVFGREFTCLLFAIAPSEDGGPQDEVWLCFPIYSGWKARWGRVKKHANNLFIPRDDALCCHKLCCWLDPALLSWNWGSWQSLLRKTPKAESFVFHDSSMEHHNVLIYGIHYMRKERKVGNKDGKIKFPSADLKSQSKS